MSEALPNPEIRKHVAQALALIAITYGLNRLGMDAPAGITGIASGALLGYTGGEIIENQITRYQE